MIKLAKILSEIKIVNGVSPEIVFNLIEIILKTNNKRDELIRLEFYHILDKHFVPDGVFIDKNKLKDWLVKQSKKTLNGLYTDLLNYKQKYSINEIRLINPNMVTPEMVDELISYIGQNIDTRNFQNPVEKQKWIDLRGLTLKYMNKQAYSLTLDDVKNLPKNQLSMLYQDLIKYKEKHNIN